MLRAELPVQRKSTLSEIIDDRSLSARGARPENAHPLCLSQFRRHAGEIAPRAAELAARIAIVGFDHRLQRLTDLHMQPAGDLALGVHLELPVAGMLEV